MGRSKLTDNSQQVIVDAILLGMYQEQAALLAGIHRGTFYRWMERGNTGLPEDEPYRDFRDAVEKARAEAEARKLKAIHIAADTGTWQAAAWWLERSFPKRWGRKVEHTVITRDELLEALDAEIALLEAEANESYDVDAD